MKNKDKYTSLFCEMYKIDPEDECVTEIINARDLIVPERLDLMSKKKWIEAYKSNNITQFHEDLYYEDIKVMTNSMFVEFNNIEKNSFDKYKASFINTYENIKKYGFDNMYAIPVGENNAILDGAHRLSCAIAENIQIPINRIKGAFIKCDANLFLSRNMPEEIVDYLVYEYIKEKNNILVFCLWPVSYNKKLRELAESQIVNAAKIVYKKNVFLTKGGLRNLFIQIYRNYNWNGTIENHFVGIDSKVDKCYKQKSYATFYFLENITIKELKALKERIRCIFELDTHSCHSTDSTREALSIAKMVLNKNTIDIFNSEVMDYNYVLNKEIERIKEENLESLDDIIITSNLEMYLCKNIAPEIINVERYENLEKCDRYLYNVFLDPRKHFVYNGIKIITCDEYLKCCENKKEKSQIAKYKASKVNKVKNCLKKIKSNLILLPNKIYAKIVLVVIKNQRMYETVLRIKNRVKK